MHKDGVEMATENRIDLINEIGTSKNCELIILTTFSFDPLFFDTIILKNIRKRNLTARVVVLADSNHINFENRTELTGTDYRIIALPSTFHPKIFVFSGRKTSKTIIGSHNLTLSGFCNNLEITNIIKGKETAKLSLQLIKDFLKIFLEKEDSLLTEIENQLKKKNGASQPETHLISNLEKAIIDQVTNTFTAKKWKGKKVLVISPFYSQVNTLCEKIKEIIKPKEIILCVQKNNHTLSPQQVQDLNYVSFLEVKAKNRRIHSKIILFQGTKNTIGLIGSPNFTGAALNEKYQMGKHNFEISALIKGDRISQLISELVFSNISIADIEKSRIKTPFNRLNSFSHHIFSASFNSLEGLVIQYSSNSTLEKYQLILKSINGTENKFSGEFSLNPETRKITFGSVNTVEPGTIIWLCSQTGIQISNKTFVNIYNNIRQIAKNLGTQSSGNLLKILANTNSLEDLIYLTLSFSNPDEIKTKKSNQTHNGDKQEFLEILPSGRKNKTSTKNIVELLENLYHLSKVQKRTGNIKQKKTLITKSELIDVEKQIKRIPLKFRKFFEQKKLAIDNEPDTYTLYLLYSIKLGIIFKKIFQLEDIDDLIIRKTILSLPYLMNKYGISGGNYSNFFTLLIFVEAYSRMSLSKGLFKKLLKKSDNTNLDLFDIRPLKHMGLPVREKEDYFKVAEKMVISILIEKTNFWRDFKFHEEIRRSLTTYFQTMIKGYEEIKLKTFNNAILGDYWALEEIKNYSLYPVVGSDNLPVFNVIGSPKFVLESVFEILIKGYPIKKENKFYPYIKKIIVDVLNDDLKINKKRRFFSFVPGNILRKIIEKRVKKDDL